MPTKTFLLSCFVFAQLHATEPFTLERMQEHLTQKNPYVYSALGKKYVARERLSATEGLFDAKIVAKYDEKQYPLSDGTYYGASLEKPTEFGVDLSAGYRYAYGTQEYNNIKTSQNGEFIAGAKLPIVALLNQIDERRLKAGLTKIELTQSDYVYKEAMRSLYFRIMSDYYLLLRHKEVLKISQNMLQKVEKRNSFLKSNVTKGNLPKITLLEASQQRIQAEQNLRVAKRDYENKFTELLGYLNVTQERFDALYHLPELRDDLVTLVNAEESLRHALQKRADLKIFNTEIEKLLLENKNNERKKYPEINLGLFGLQDSDEQSGFKVSLDMSFPIAQSEYRAKNREIQESIKVVSSDKDRILIELEVDIKKILNSLDVVVKNLQSAKEEAQLLVQLEVAERRKYELGASTLFLLNQREMLTMNSLKKVVAYKLEYRLLLESYKRIVGENTPNI